MGRSANGIIGERMRTYQKHIACIKSTTDISKTQIGKNWNRGLLWRTVLFMPVLLLVCPSVGNAQGPSVTKAQQLNNAGISIKDSPQCPVDVEDLLESTVLQLIN